MKEPASRLPLSSSQMRCSPFYCIRFGHSLFTAQKNTYLTQLIIDIKKGIEAISKDLALNQGYQWSELIYTNARYANLLRQQGGIMPMHINRDIL